MSTRRMIPVLDNKFVEQVEQDLMRYEHTTVDEDKIIRGFEKRELIKIGKKDGKKGYPRFNDSNIVTSSYISVEVESFNEALNEHWMYLQLQQEGKIQELKTLHSKLGIQTC